VVINGLAALGKAASSASAIRARRAWWPPTIQTPIPSCRSGQGHSLPRGSGRPAQDRL